MKDEKEYFYKRAFLNRKGHHTTAHILGEVSVWGKDEHSSVEGSLSIADCSRQINISIDTYTKNDLNNSIRKLKIIRDTCDNIITSLESAWAEVQDRKQKARDKVKKKVK